VTGRSVRRFSLPALNWLRYPDGDDPTGAGPIPGQPLAAFLDGAAAAGFVGVGLDNYTLGEHDPDRVAAMLRDRGLACTDIGVLPIGTTGLDEVAEMLVRLAAATGAPTCIAALFAPVEHARAVAELERCAERLGQAGTRLAVEFGSYGGLTRLADAVALCQEVGWDRCGVLVDTWHFFRTDAPWEVLRSLSGEQIALVHVNDGPAVPGDDLMREGRFGRLPVGAGAFPLPKFAAALDDAGYEGPLSIEVLSDDVRNRPPGEGARLLFASLRDGWPAS
jgi:sugar phosphate isomerase/epimerase